MKLFVIPFFMVASAFSCFNTSTINTQDNRSGGSPTGSGSLCAGVVQSLNVDSESGSTVKAGHNITFSADPRDASGASVPAACREGAVTVEALGECVPTSAAAPPTLDAILLFANAPGECQARVTFAGVVGVSSPVTINP